jgi:copper chaperone CopZ
MTRARCIVTVMNTLERLSGVESVDVDLVSGGVSQVTVTSSRGLQPQAVRDALDEVGYTLVSSPLVTV